MNTGSLPPGWHGKLPSLGDFASRRLDSSFIDPWDAWLSSGLLALSESQPDAWLQDYLASPSWCFLIMPGALPGTAGVQAWAGVLMPSVDRVGRYFPFTLALALGVGPASTAQMPVLWAWLARLDELARDALYDDWTVDRLELELARLPGHGMAAMPPPQVGTVAGFELACGSGLDAATHIGIQAQRAWAAQAHGRVWWQARPDGAPARLRVSRGLPPAAAMAHLLGAAATI